MSKIQQFSVGQQVVLMFSPGTPIYCNQGSVHPSRVTISKIGRSRIYVACENTDRQPVGVEFTEGKYHTIQSIEDAQQAYRAALEAREALVASRNQKPILTPSEITMLVQAL